MTDLEDNLLDAGDIPTPTKQSDADVPMYKLISNNRIPVSKKVGKRFYRLRNDVTKVIETEKMYWTKALSDYRLVGLSERASANVDNRNDINLRNVEENIVRENVRLLSRAAIVRNPQVSFSTRNGGNKEFAALLQEAVQNVIERRTGVGLNLKMHLRKLMLVSLLTNYGYIKVDQQEVVGSLEEQRAARQEIINKLADVKENDELEELYGELAAIDDRMPGLRTAGIHCKVLEVDNIITDPLACNSDESDAEWMMERIYLDPEYVKSLYTKRDGESEQRSIYAPNKKTRIGSTDRSGSPVDEGVNISDFLSAEFKQYRDDNTTECWLVWDRLARMVYLYHEDDWTHPLWVWDDPLKTSYFFPYYRLQFSDPIGSHVQPGEVSYYDGFVQQINKVYKKRAKIMDSVFNGIAYNGKTIDPENIKKIVSYINNPGAEAQAISFKLNEGGKVSDQLEAIVPPAANYKELFDYSSEMAAIDRLSDTNDALRGTQFKANTTEDAAQLYATAAQGKIEDMREYVKEVVERIAWSVAEMIVQWPPEMIANVLSEESAQAWQPVSVQELNYKYNITVAASSMESPTSAVKKKEAVEIGQVLGQFGQFAPMTILKVTLRMFKEAYSGSFNVTEEDFATIAQEVQLTLQRGSTTPPPEKGQANA